MLSALSIKQKLRYTTYLFHLVLRDVKINSKSQVGKVDMVEFRYHVE